MSLLISHPLSTNIPLYPGTPAPKLEAFQTVNAGGSASTTVMINTHSGTHVDLPRHFSDEGEDVRDLLPPLKIFEPAYCIDVAAGDGEIITWKNISPYVKGLENAQALLLRTGYHRHRGESEQKYIRDHPWLDPSLADALMDELPFLELIGLDLLSAASPSHPEEGADIHKRLLLGRRIILLMEDADLSAEELVGRAWRLSMVPVIWERLDATPVVAWVDPV